MVDGIREEIWQRWFPKFLDAYRARLPPAATGRMQRD